MKILYLCNVNQNSVASVGVFRKISAQRKLLIAQGHDVALAYYKNENEFCIKNTNDAEVRSVALTATRGNKRTAVVLSHAIDYVLKNKLEVVYSRFETFSLPVSTAYKKLKKHGVKVLLEIPTYPLTQRWTSIKTSFAHKKYKTAIHQLFNATLNSLGIYQFKYGVDRIVNNNDYNEIWGIPAIKIHNGVEVASMPKHQMRNKSDAEVRLIGVANLARWHGYDRIIAGMKNYYREDHAVKVYFDIFGCGLELETLQKMTQTCDLNQYVIFHGVAVGEALDTAFENADIGVSVLGAHRSGMKTCDALKSKEYCARHMPFLTGCIESAYQNQPFAMTIPDNETAIDISAVVRFVQSFERDADAMKQIKEYAEQYCDWSYAFANVLKYLENLPCTMH